MRFLFLFMISVGLLLASDIFKDNNTTLVWQDNIEVKNKMKWEDAYQFCNKLVLYGYDDWRLPSIKELQSIVDVDHYKPAIKKGFENVQNDFYWSSSDVVSEKEEPKVWVVDFEEGGIYTAYTLQHDSKNYVRCVRGKKLF